MIEKIKCSYVGVSGVVSPETQASLESIYNQVGLADNNRILALGVKAVHKTQFLDIENNYGKDWYPVGEESFTSALRHNNSNPQTIAVAQTHLDLGSVESAEYRKAFTDRIIRSGKPWLQAIRFDMLPWHINNETLNFIEEFKIANEDLQIFLQVHRYAMTELRPKDVIRRLGSIRPDYLLFDASQDTDTTANIAALRPYIAEAYDSLDSTKTGITIAGGLDGHVVREELPVVVDEFPSISWDAEDRLHPARPDSTRPLDLPTVKDYLQASADILPTRHNV